MAVWRGQAVPYQQSKEGVVLRLQLAGSFHPGGQTDVIGVHYRLGKKTVFNTAIASFRADGEVLLDLLALRPGEGAFSSMAGTLTFATTDAVVDLGRIELPAYTLIRVDIVAWDTAAFGLEVIFI